MRDDSRRRPGWRCRTGRPARQTRPRPPASWWGPPGFLQGTAKPVSLAFEVRLKIEVFERHAGAEIDEVAPVPCRQHDAVADHLPAQQGGSAVEIDQIDLAPNYLLELGAQRALLQQRQRLRERDRYVDVVGGIRTPGGRRAEERCQAHLGPPLQRGDEMAGQLLDGHANILPLLARSAKQGWAVPIPR